MSVVYNKNGLQLFNGDCIDYMDILSHKKKKADIILTSPPYNSSRIDSYSRKKDKYASRYDVYVDNISNSDYLKWSVDLFHSFDKILSKNGVILYNFSYSNQNQDLMWLLTAEIINKTPFSIQDCIVWRKKYCIPPNKSSNKLGRICEFIFVISRKSEASTFIANKQIVSKDKNTGHNNYQKICNFIEAENGMNTFNNGFKSKLNSATFSTDLVKKLLSLYAQPDMIIYDPFVGSGTSLLACLQYGLKCYGSELSKAQCNLAIERITKLLKTEKETVSIDIKKIVPRHNNVPAIANRKEFLHIKLLRYNKKWYFPGIDTIKILGYKNPRKAIRDHCKEVTNRSSLTNGGKQNIKYISENDLYRLIHRSRLESARRFEKYILTNFSCNSYKD